MKIAVVTGASSGLGREYVRLLAEKSEKYEKLDEIWVIARRAERLEELKKDSPVPLRVIAADLTDESQLRKIGGFLQAEKPELRLLVNAAGFGKIGSFETIPPEESARMIDLDCRAPVMLCQIALLYMPSGARILNVCSTAGFSPFQFLAVYSASKSFLYRYSRALRVELLSRGISVTAVCPYWIRDTEFIPTAENRKTIYVNEAAGSSKPIGANAAKADAEKHMPAASAKTDPAAGTAAGMSTETAIKTAGESGLQEPAQQRFIRHYPLSSTRKTVAAWSLGDTYRRFAVSTPGPVCTAHRIAAKVIPSELMMGIWALLRRV